MVVVFGVDISVEDKKIGGFWGVLVGLVVGDRWWRRWWWWWRRCCFLFFLNFF